MSAITWDYIAKLVCIGDSGCGKSSLAIRLSEGRFANQPGVTIGLEVLPRVVPVGPPHSRTLPPAKSSASPGATVATRTTPQAPNDDATAAAATGGGGGLPDPPRAAPADGPQKYMWLSVWDTAGQETYRSVTQSYFRNASGALLVFDLTRRDTFLHATSWLRDLREKAEPDHFVILVGNKADLARTDGDDDDDDDLGVAAAEAAAASTTTAMSAAAANRARRSGGGSRGSRNKREVTREEAEAWVRSHSENVLEYIETSAKSGENVELAFMRLAERIYQSAEAGKYNLHSTQSGVKYPSTIRGNGNRQLQRYVDNRAGRTGGYGGCC